MVLTRPILQIFERDKCSGRQSAAGTMHMAYGNVLVVEDDDSLRRITELHLQKLGFSTSVCGDAEEAVRELHVSPYDVLLTDLNLPGMSGLDLLKHVRTEYPEMIIIIITAF